MSFQKSEMDLSYEKRGSESWGIPVCAVVKVIIIRNCGSVLYQKSTAESLSTVLLLTVSCLWTQSGITWKCCAEFLIVYRRGGQPVATGPGPGEKTTRVLRVSVPGSSCCGAAPLLLPSYSCLDTLLGARQTLWVLNRKILICSSCRQRVGAVRL